MTVRDAVFAALGRMPGDWATVSTLAFRDGLDRNEVAAALRQMAAEGQAVREIHEDATGLVERWRLKWTARAAAPQLKLADPT